MKILTLREILLILLLVSLLGNLFLIFKFFELKSKISQNKIILAKYRFNEKVLNFGKLFLAKVLKAEKEVDFETRLELENAVREIGDPEILNQWEKFVKSQTEKEAQREVKNLLELLFNKIKI